MPPEAVGTFYTPTANRAVLISVDDKRVTSDRYKDAAFLNYRIFPNIVYVLPGVREIEIGANWNNTEYRAADRVDVKAGHTYKVTFDKVKVGFIIDDLGANVEPNIHE